MINKKIESKIDSFIKELKTKISFNVNFEYKLDKDSESYYIYYDNKAIKTKESQGIIGSLILKYFYNNDIYNVHLNDKATNVKSNKDLALDFNELLSNTVSIKMIIPDSLNLNYCDNMIKFANFLYDYRNTNNISREKMAEILDVATKDIWDYESAEQDLLFKSMCNIARTLGYKITININKKTSKG